MKSNNVDPPEKTVITNSHFPIVAHQPSEVVSVSPDGISPNSLKCQTSPKTSTATLSPSESTTTSPSCDSPQVPNLLTCLDVAYESREQVSGVSYRTQDGKEEWTPVVKRKRKIRMRGSQSDSDESEVDVSCSRLVQYEEREGLPGLRTCRMGPATWTPIKPAKPEPVASRTRSKTLNT